jgi:uncharacterized DUF497 family protein
MYDERHPRHASDFEWDDGNESELWDHSIVADEVHDVWCSGPTWVPNRKHRAGDWKMIGRTRGGRRLTIVVRHYPDRSTVRPITGWDCTKAELSKYFKE